MHLAHCPWAMHFPLTPCTYFPGLVAPTTTSHHKSLKYVAFVVYERANPIPLYDKYNSG